MKFTIDHVNINITDVARSVAFYEEALGLTVTRTVENPNFVLTFMTDGNFLIELTWLADKSSYDLGDNESHIAFRVDDAGAAHALHERMGCICYENTQMGLYFIEDPDGYWLEIIPKRR